MIWNRAFWRGAVERAIKTFFQTLIALIGASVVFTDVDWALVLSGSGLATLLSLATSIGNANFTSGEKEVTSTVP